MLFSTNQGNIKPQILFNNEDVEFVVNHKHLGVTFSSNCKWHCHIQNILKSTSGQLSMLRKFKIKLNRENLEKIYFTYIRPLLEYACELWDGCTILDLNKIEQIQHEAARIVTGLPKFASIESLYFETGWEPLHSRRHSRKLNLFYKIRNNDSPLYLYDCLLPFIREENELNLRNQTEFRNPFTRLQLFANSFFHSTIKSLNKLSPQLRNAPTLNRFKQANTNHTIKPSKFYIAGCRILNIIHTRLRHRSSSLNADLFRVHLANDPGCICGCAFEDAIHYILECCLYNKAREELKLRLVFLHELKIEVLLFGDESLTEMQNLQIFKYVRLYHKRTKRFTHS